jgi:hypothetical protein
MNFVNNDFFTMGLRDWLIADYDYVPLVLSGYFLQALHPRGISSSARSFWASDIASCNKKI